jgi:aminopeptidase-like protein
MTATTSTDLHGAAERALPSRETLGPEAFALAERLLPLRRSLTGAGVRETLRVLGELIPLEVTEVPSGTKVFDWEVPAEWNVGEAWIADSEGSRLADLSDHPLHVLGYSDAVDGRFSGAELQQHLWSLPDRPELIPARTSYWERRWGFCLADRVRREIRDDAEYQVRIDATHDAAGSLTYAEAVVPGTTDDEILISTYTCHPGLANDGLSGIVVAALLVRSLPPGTLRHTVRLLLAPATIGAIAWLAANEDRLERIHAGVVVSCAGDRGPLTVKHSRRGDTAVDAAAAMIVNERGGSERPFVPWGTDERQFCSPGFDLPVIALTRTPHGEFPEHHTSADDLSLLDPSSLAESVAALAAIIDVVDRDRRPVNLVQKGEPRLGERGLYPTLSAGVPGGAEPSVETILWVLNLSDGEHSLLEIAEQTGIRFALVADAADALVSHGLLADDDRVSHP